VTGIQWTITVVCAVALVFTIFRLWDKDVKGAFLLALGVILIAFAAISVSGCTVSREYQPWMEVGFGYDFSHTVGSDPQCIVRLRQPIGFGPLEPDWLILGYQHVSSCPDLYDSNTIDAVEIMARIPLGRPK
jgi:hypothetical protein